MKIYILVLVTYDHYRFQENLWATSSKEEMEKMIKKIKGNMKKTNPIQNPSFYWYDSESSEEASKLSDREEMHFWIQTLEINKF